MDLSLSLSVNRMDPMIYVILGNKMNKNSTDNRVI